MPEDNENKENIIESVNLESTSDNNSVNVSNIEKEEIEIKEKNNKQNYVASEKKKTVYLILLFVFLFAFVIEMPRIQGLIDKLKNSGTSEIEKRAKKLEENEKKKQDDALKQKKEAEVEILDTYKCTLVSDAYSNEYTTTLINELLVNKNGEVISNNFILQYDYHDKTTEFNNLNNECINSKLKLKEIDGFTYMCSSNENQLKFVYKFELSKLDKVEYEKVDGTSATVTASVKYKTSLTDAKNELIAKGFSCE